MANRIKQAAKRWLDIVDTHVRQRQPLKISEQALSASRPAPSQRRQLVSPALPPGVIPRGGSVAQLAMDDAPGSSLPVWGWANSMQGIGCGLFFPGYPYLAELAQRPEYRSPVETIAEEMTRKWIEFKSTGDNDVSDKIEQIEQAFTEHGLQDKFRRATELDGYFGRSQLYIDIKGQENSRDVPLLVTPETVRKGMLRGFKVIEPMWTTPVVWNAMDPTAEDFYKPTTWYVLGRATHATRLITFISREVPDLLKPSYNFGGISLTQMLETYVTQWLRTRDAVADLINNFSKMVLMTDMEAVLSNGDGADLMRRIQLAIQTGNNQGFFAINKDSEDIKNVVTTLAGLNELMAQFQEHMSAVSRLPLIKAFGITPSGLNASSDGEIMVFNDHIHARQEIQYTSPITLCLKLIQLDLFGEIDDSIVHDYVPLKELDGEALARVRKSDGETDIAYINAGVVDPEEVRDKVAHDPDSGFTNLNLAKEIEPPAMQLAQMAQPGDGEDRDEAA